MPKLTGRDSLHLQISNYARLWHCSLRVIHKTQSTSVYRHCIFSPLTEQCFAAVLLTLFTMRKLNSGENKGTSMPIMQHSDEVLNYPWEQGGKSIHWSAHCRKELAQVLEATLSCIVAVLGLKTFIIYNLKESIQHSSGFLPSRGVSAMRCVLMSHPVLPGFPKWL